MGSKRSSTEYETQIPSKRVRMTGGSKDSYRQASFAIEPDSALRTFPVELRVLILQQAPDISTLHNLILSSKIFSTAYYGQQRSIIQDVLSKALGSSILIDAYSVIKARKIGASISLNSSSIANAGRNASRKQWLSNAKGFLEDYRKPGSNPTIMYKIYLEDLHNIHRLCRLVQIVAREYCKVTLSKCPVPDQDLDFQYENLSENEIQRIYGAIMRLEICCALWGDLGQIGDEIEGNDIRYLAKFFFSKLHVWEIEEVACIRDFLFRFYDRLYGDCKNELDALFYRRESWRYEGNPDVSRETRQQRILERVDELTDEDSCSSMSEVLMSGGVELHAKMIRCGGGQATAQQKVQYMEDCGELNDSIGVFLSDHLKDYWVFANGEEKPGPTITSENAPNPAWARYLIGLQSDRTISNRPMLDRYPRVDLRSWGFVMWDQENLEKIMKRMGLSDIVHQGPRLWQGRGLGRDTEMIQLFGDNATPF